MHAIGHEKIIVLKKFTSMIFTKSKFFVLYCNLCEGKEVLAKTRCELKQTLLLVVYSNSQLLVFYIFY